MAQHMRIKDWKKHQHFKNRRPPWIKIYRALLDDPEWFRLTGDESKLLVNLWLLAAEDKTKEGLLPDIKTISFRLRVDINVISTMLPKLNHWVEGVDINLISKCVQVGPPETETETETEAETETTSAPSAQPPAAAARQEESPPTSDKLDQDRELWKQGIEFLVSKGSKKEHASSFLGRMIKLHGKDRLLLALSAAIGADADKPIPYITKIISAEAKLDADPTAAQRAKWERDGCDEWGRPLRHKV